MDQGELTNDPLSNRFQEQTELINKNQQYQESNNEGGFSKLKQSDATIEQNYNGAQQTPSIQRSQLIRRSTVKNALQKSMQLKDNNQKQHSYVNNGNQGQKNIDQTELDPESIERAKKHLMSAHSIGKKQRIIRSMNKFIENLPSRRYKSLQTKHFLTLNDLSIIKQVKKQHITFSQKIGRCFELIDTAISSLCCCKVFHPYNNFNYLNQIVESMVTIFCLFYYSLFCFYDYFEKDFIFYLTGISLVIFSIGTFLRVNTGYFDQGQIVFDRKKIIKKYRKEVMFYDLVGFIGQVYQFVNNDNSQFAKILCFLLIFKYKVYLLNIDKIEDRFNFTGNMIYVWQLVRLMCTSLALCHFVGVAYYFVAFCESYYLDEKNTWVDKMDLWDKSPAAQYVESYYWALATMTLIGTKGETVIETGYCIIVLIVTIGIFATILSKVAQVNDEMDQKVKGFKRDKDILTSFFELHDITKNLQGQLHNYLKYSFQGHREKKANSEFQELLGQFPFALQEIVQIERYSSKIQNFSLLTNTFTTKTVQQLINFIEEEYYMPNQLIIKKGVQQEPKLYLILKGQAQVYSETNGSKDSVMITLKDGDFFGENTFFTNSVPFYSVKSNEDSFMTCISIKRSDFIKIISQSGSEQDKERFYQIKDEIKFNEYSVQLDQACYICDKRNHAEEHCNLLYYTPNKINLLTRYNFSINQDRNTIEIKRKLENRFNAWNDLDLVQDRSFNILSNPKLRQFLKIIQEYQAQLEKGIINSSDDEDMDQDDFEQKLEEDDDDDTSEDDDFIDNLKFSNSPDLSQQQQKKRIRRLSKQISGVSKYKTGTIINSLITDSQQNQLGSLTKNTNSQLLNYQLDKEDLNYRGVATTRNAYEQMLNTQEQSNNSVSVSVNQMDSDNNQLDEYQIGDRIKLNKQDMQLKNQQKFEFLEKKNNRPDKPTINYQLENSSSQKIHQQMGMSKKQIKKSSTGNSLIPSTALGGNLSQVRRKSQFMNLGLTNNIQQQANIIQKYGPKGSSNRKQSRDYRKQSIIGIGGFQMRRNTNLLNPETSRCMPRKSQLFQNPIALQDPFQATLLNYMGEISSRFNDFYNQYLYKQGEFDEKVHQGLFKHEFYYFEFDEINNYIQYFPHNNFTQVMRDIKHYNIQAQRKTHKRSIFGNLGKKKATKDIFSNLIKSHLKKEVNNNNSNNQENNFLNILSKNKNNQNNQKTQANNQGIKININGI